MTRPSNPRPRPAPDFIIALGRDRVAALAVSLAPVLYFLPAVLNGSVLCPDDGTIFNTPLRVAAADITLGGSLPLWNPYIFGGMPLLATAQGGLLFPPNWFYLAFTPQAATNLMVVSSYVVAALGAYLYARRAGATVAGAVVTSLAWQWGGFLVGQIGHINVVQTGAVLPWVLWALDGYAVTGRRKWGVALAALVALQTFAGHQQTLAYSLLLASAYATACACAQTGAARARYLWTLLFVAAGVLVAAVQILPTFELLRNSPRSDATYDFFTSFSLEPGMLWTFLAPYVAGGGDGRLFRAPYVGPPYYGEMAGYVGALALMLAACAVVFRRDARTKFWAAVALVCLLLALGRYAPLGLYKLVYYVPVLNLFRVPARHLMEVEFALAVLAGRGLTALTLARGTLGRAVLGRAAAVGASVLVLTFAAVTWGRPEDFKLARRAPVTLMRAPELFVPLLVACASAWALWAFARGRRGATVLLVGLLALDLLVWGQSSGWWFSSPKTDGELWREPEPAALVRKQAGSDPAAYRILTAPHAFDPAVAPVPPSVSHSPEWTLWTQPDVYMMHGVPNAAGYDGFGLARYSRLAGEMKVWGELTDPESSLQGESREIDLLNVRYLVSMRAKAAAKPAAPEGAGKDVAPADATKTAPTAVVPAPAQEFPQATEKHGDFMFGAGDLGLPNLGAGRSLRFRVAPTLADRVALLTNLSWSEDVPDGATVGRVSLRARDGRVFGFALRAGADTAEWAHDRADIRARVRHRRAAVATSYKVADVKGDYEGHTYVTSFALPAPAEIEGGEISVEPSTKWPDLLLGVFRVSLVDTASGKSYPLRREWLTVERATRSTGVPTGLRPPDDPRIPGTHFIREGVLRPDGDEGDEGKPRWSLLGRTAREEVYENARALPRAWLASEGRALDEEATLGVIRKGRLPDGSRWEPLRTALVEPGVGSVVPAGGGDAGGSAEVVRYEPNRVEVRTKAVAPSILVLAENHYPGWRAYLDGRRVDMLRVNYAQRGVRVPAGEHEVVFRYRPASFYAGLALSLLAAAALLLWSRRRLPEERLLGLAARLRRRTLNQGVKG
ncbi:MAG: YfhO family protein [Acidobacteria bacterium]|nr:YfhO family protein [Acidobacteriota bacterium]